MRSGGRGRRSVPLTSRYARSTGNDDLCIFKQMRVTWYFDFISPFAYLQCERLDRLPEETEIEYRPVLFAALLSHWGQKGNAEILSKRRFTYRQSLWVARREGIPFRAPAAHPFNPLGALRLAIALGCKGDTIRSIFRFIWAEGHRPDDADNWNALKELLSVPDADDRIESPGVKLALRANTEEAIDLGVFGVPTIAVEKELFWGFDMTDMAIAYIRDPVAFEDTEM